MDRAAACRSGSGQPRPHVGTHRGGHHRRREPAAEVRQGVVRPGGARPRRRHRPVGWNRDGQRPDHRSVAARPAGDGVAGDPAEFSGARLGFRRPGGRRAAGRRRRHGDPRRTRGSAVDLVCHRRVDLRPQPHHRDGPGAGDRLHPADDQPVPRRVGRGREPRRRPRANDGVGGPHRDVLRHDGRPVDGGPGAVPDALPEVVRLRRRRDRRIRRGRCDRGDTRRTRSARRSPGLARRAPARPPHARPPRTATRARRAEVLVPLRELRYAQSSSARSGRCGVAVAARRAVPERALGIPRRSCAAEVGLRSSGRRPAAARLRQQLRRRGDCRRSRHQRRQRIRHRQVCSRPVSRARRARGVCSDRNIRRRQPNWPAVGAGRTDSRQRIPHRRKLGSAVLRPVGSSARPPARGTPGPQASTST